VIYAAAKRPRLPASKPEMICKLDGTVALARPDLGDDPVGHV
jgi:hypothetical protein